MTKDEFLATDYNNLLRAEFPEEYSSEPAGTIIRQTPKAGRTVRKAAHRADRQPGHPVRHDPRDEEHGGRGCRADPEGYGSARDQEAHVRQLRGQRRCCLHPARRGDLEGDSTVILYVSRSEVSKESSVPSLTGKTIEEARNEVKGLNLSIRTIEQASEQPAGTVLSQSPDAGSTVRKSSVITLVVSTGVPEVVATPEPVEPTVNRAVPSLCRRAGGRVLTAVTRSIS